MFALYILLFHKFRFMRLTLAHWRPASHQSVCLSLSLSLTFWLNYLVLFTRWACCSTALWGFVRPSSSPPWRGIFLILNLVNVKVSQ